MDQLLNSQALAEKLGVHRNTVSTWVREGKLRPRRVGRVLIFSPADVAAARQLLGASQRVHGRRTDLYQPFEAATGPTLHIGAAAELLGKHENTVRRWIESGRLVGYRKGLHTVHVLRADVERLAAADHTRAA